MLLSGPSLLQHKNGQLGPDNNIGNFSAHFFSKKKSWNPYVYSVFCKQCFFKTNLAQIITLEMAKLGPDNNFTAYIYISLFLSLPMFRCVSTCINMYIYIYITIYLFIYISIHIYIFFCRWRDLRFALLYVCVCVCVCHGVSVSIFDVWCFYSFLCCSTSVSLA